MKFLSIISSLLLVGTVVASPTTGIRQERNRKRIEARKSRPNERIDRVEAASAVGFTNDSYVEYSSNWAGAVLIGTGYTSVTGTFTVPSPSTDGSGAAWVGIDGDTCGSAILQAGVSWTRSGGSTSYDAWYEWYPDYSYDFNGFSVSAGDSITVTVTATSTTSGTAIIVNNSNGGDSVEHDFSNEGSLGSLCEYNAEWIVEDYEQNGGLVAFADFGTVTFTGATATDDGSTVDTTGATIFDIEQNGQVLTDCSASGSEVTCSYT